MEKYRDLQFRPAGEIKRFQDEKLRETVRHLSRNSPYYSRVFRENNVNVDSIRTVSDLTGLPVTTKRDIQLYGSEMICVPKERILDYVTTSGTLGAPVEFAVTAADLDRLAYNEALSFDTAGCVPGDVIQLMVTIDRRFMAGLAYFMGAREGGFGVIRVGNGIPELQWDTINRIRPNTCIVIPSFLIKLMDYAEEHGIDYRNSSLRRAICIGESLRNDDFSPSRLGARINERWPELSIHSTYASTEMQTSFTECGYMQGGHLPPELIIAELLGEDNQPVAPGEAGELTITTIGVEGMPLFRFKTGDICRIHTGPCPCGRNTPRLGPLLGRQAQMIKYKGTTLYPPAIMDVLYSVPEISNFLIEVFTGELGTDQIRIKVVSANEGEAFTKHLKDLFRSRIRVAPEIIFTTEDELAKIQMPAVNRKPKKIVFLNSQAHL